MPSFHDRRRGPNATVDEARSRIDSGEKDTFSKDLIDGRYLVRGGRPTDPETGKASKVDHFVVHEVLPNGKVIERGTTDRRYRAHNLAAEIAPTSVYDLR